MVKPHEFIAANLIFLVLILMLDVVLIRNMTMSGGAFGFLKVATVTFIIPWLGWKLPQMILQFKANKRRNILEVQLAEALTLISSGLKGGYSFIQGLTMASEQLQAPITEEITRVVRLIQLGLDTPRALDQLAQRVNSYDYDMTVSATNIQLSSGGNLSTLLEKIAETIRDRIRLRRDIAALTAQGRMSGAILIALPIGIAFMLNIINGEYFALLYTTTLGKNLLTLAFIKQLIGVYWIKKLLDFDN
jgi:tight adherence protein B